MTDRPEDAGQTELDMADRKMLAEIKANVLGSPRVELRIGRFRVLERLGEGSMGIVFAAVDDQLQRRVAIKLLHQGVGASEDERKARLLREAQILAQLEHPNIVRVHEAGEHDGHVFMAMELVEGEGLDALQRTRPPGEWKALLPLYVAAGRGLAAAHAKGVVHRDFKPSNVLVDANGRVRVVDFGLARESAGADEQLTGEVALSYEGAIEQPRVDHLTASGIVPGTPAYMAPELFDGQPASPASDQFSFCVALYEAVYGRRPFEGDRLKDVVAAAKHGQILPAPADRSVPKWLFEVLARGLAASPEARFQSMDALLDELERDRTRRWKQAGVVLGAVVVIGGAWWVGGHSGDEAAKRRHEKACREQAAELAAHWEGVKPRLARPTVEREDVDGLSTMLDADAKPFFADWERACAVDMKGDTESCRAKAKREFENAVHRGTSRPLHVDAFHELTYELDLCLEDRVPGSCRGPELDSPAVMALGHARAAELAGDLDGAREGIEAALGLAAEAGDELTGLRAMLRRGALLENGGEIEAAREILAQVVEHALVCDADVLAFDAALERAEVEVLHFGKLGPAERALITATKLHDKLGDLELPLRRARLFEKRGDAALYLQHDCAAALPLLEEALEQRERLIAERLAEGLPTRHLERLAANAELNLANVGYYALTEGSDSCKLEGLSKESVIQSYHTARRRLVDAVDDPQHLELAEFDYDLGVILMRLGDYDAAIAPLESALSIYTAQHGPQSPVVGDVHRALATAHGEAERLDLARQHAEANIRIRLRDGGQLARAEAYEVLGMIQHAQGASDDARDSLGRAVESLDLRPRADLELNELEQLYSSELNLAIVELDRGDQAGLRRAVERLRETRRAIEAKTGDPLRDSAQQRLVEAAVLVDEGKGPEALVLLGDVTQQHGYHATLDERIEKIRQRAGAMK